MKRTKKILSLALCAVLLVAGTVATTVAYLTDNDSVENTFTVGNVDIELDEAPVGADGKETTGDRQKENSYHLLPGHEYDKDPMVTVESGSEDCYLFVKVENELATLRLEATNDEDGYQNIEAQMIANGWVKTSEDNVWYYGITEPASATAVSAGTQKVVFEHFKITNSATDVDLGTVSTKTEADPTVIKITAYAIQEDGIEATAIDDMLVTLNLKTAK